jgi:DNA modification methylase
LSSDTPCLAVAYRAAASLIPNRRNARTHSKRQVRQIADSIRAFGFLSPILIDDQDMVIAGHGRLSAAELLGMDRVPTLRASGLSEAQKRAYVLADNRLAERAGWDRELLASELGELAVLLPEINLDLTVIGFEPGEIDLLFADRDESRPDPMDEVPPLQPLAVSRPGDLWRLGAHRLICGDARSEADLDRLMGGERACVTFTDPPYNVRVNGHVGGRGRVRHREFAFASGEMSAADFTTFLRESFANIARVCRDGAIAFICMDWRHMVECHAAGMAAFTELKNLVVWNKTSPGQGSFYRSQHELVFVFKAGTAPHRNSFGLGSHGRARSNVWTYPGANVFRAGRMDDLAMHPTVKPIAMVMDALRDCSLKGDTVLDPFLGSGTTLLAAERLGRRGFGVEFDPAYVDLTIRRWQAYTHDEAVLDADGRAWVEVAAGRNDTRASENPVVVEAAP